MARLALLTALILSSVAAFPLGKPTVVVLYTKANNNIEEFENILDVTRFAFDEYNKINNQNVDFNTVEIDDKDDPALAESELKSVYKKENPIAVVGPVYSNVGLALKDFITEKQLPMISIFATHNDLTKDAPTMFQICMSNERLIITLADYVRPMIQKNKLNVSVFKDLSDFYSTDLADSFKKHMSAQDTRISEVLFRGLPGLERLKDINSKVWSPTKKDLLFLATQDMAAGKILASMESEPHAVVTVDPVNFVGIIQKIKKSKMHLKMISTAQWLPGKSAFSRKVEAAFKQKFGRDMKTPAALTFDAAYALAAAYDRAQVKKISLAAALKDGTKVTGVTGNLALGPNGERIASSAFIKEDLLQ